MTSSTYSMTTNDHHHTLTTTFPVEVDIQENVDGKIETRTVEVEAYLCSCGETGAGGYDGHHHHQFRMIDPHMVKEGIYQTSIMLYRTIPMDDGRPYHGFVKRARDRRKAWRKRAYAEHLTR
jgi:hypothetical protein